MRWENEKWLLENATTSHLDCEIFKLFHIVESQDNLVEVDYEAL